MAVISFQSVVKSYGGQVVLQGINFKVHRGETLVILGGSGSGKSTILKLVLGLEKPDAGSILIEDEEITELSEEQLLPIRSKMGMVFQEGALFDSLTVGENVAYRLREQGMKSEAEISAVVKQLLGFVDLGNTEEKMPSELSGGMRRRAAIARALAGNPRIMLYDEATAGLDPITSRVICEMMIKLRDLEDVSSIFVTHHLESAFLIAGEYAQRNADGTIDFRKDAKGKSVPTRFLVMESGRIVAEGLEEDLFASQHPYVQDLIS